MKKIMIIGGGASGLTAAITAARMNPKAQICILEHKDSPGKKILATGNGRCNLTNRFQAMDCYRSRHPEIAEKILRQFTYEETLSFFSSLGLLFRMRGDYVYPRSDQASAVLDLMLMETRRLGIQIQTGIHVERITRSAKGFCIHSSAQNFQADAVILSTGGRASSALGSDGSGYTLAKSAGHSLVPVVPALVQLKVKQHPYAKAAGVRTDAQVTAVIDGKPIASDKGELQITAYGISGIPVFQISRFAADGLRQKRNVQVVIDFFPDMKGEELLSLLKRRKEENTFLTCADFFMGIFHKKMIPRFLERADIRMDQKASGLTDRQLHRLVRIVKADTVAITDTNGFENAQVCAGGVPLTEIDPGTMESRCMRQLYLAGELLDVDGICGGYNLQWAWATGYLAGRACASSGHGDTGKKPKTSGKGKRS